LSKRNLPRRAHEYEGERILNLALHALAWLLFAGFFIYLVIKFEDYWNPWRRKKPLHKVIAKLERPIKFVAWVVGVTVTITLWLTFPVKCTSTVSDDDCHIEYDNRGPHRVCE
jgi:hypothetical protein